MKTIRDTISERRKDAKHSFTMREEEQMQSNSFRINGHLPTLQEAENVLIAQAMQEAGNNKGIPPY